LKKALFYSLFYFGAQSLLAAQGKALTTEAVIFFEKKESGCL
jgi:hypothetical protein